MSTEPSPAPDGNAPHPHAPEQRSARRRGRRLSVAAIAAAVLLAGGGGAYWASTAAGGDGAGSGGGEKPPRLALDGWPARQAGADGGDGRRGVAPGEPEAPPYRATGKLPEGPEKAAVHRPAGGDGRAEAGALAKALGMRGTPQKENGRWTVRDGEGDDAATLTVRGGRAAGDWRYSGPAAREGDPVSEAAARDGVRPALDALGIRDAGLDAGHTTGNLRTVTAEPEVGGLPTHGWDSTFLLGPDGRPVHAHGSLGGTVRGDTYPVLSARETLEELNARRAGGGSGAGNAGCEEGTFCAVGRSGGDGPLEVRKATFGLSARYSGGERVLVPSWIFEARAPGSGQSHEVAHPALSPDFLTPRGDGGKAEGGAPSAPGAEPGPPSARPGGGSGTPEKTPGAGGGTDADSGAQAVTSYEADGRTLRLTFWGGVCHDYRGTAEESGDRVEVGVLPEGGDSGKICVKVAKRQTVTVELERPLDGRKVVDARGGDRLPAR